MQHYCSIVPSAEGEDSKHHLLNVSSIHGLGVTTVVQITNQVVWLDQRISYFAVDIVKLSATPTIYRIRAGRGCQSDLE